MKKNYLVMLLAFFAVATMVRAQVQINATNFPDENFRSFLAGNTIDRDGNGSLSTEEIGRVTRIVLDGKGIKSLKGIEVFTKLLYLDCCNNELTELDLSNNKVLQHVYVDGNQIKGEKMTVLVNSLSKAGLSDSQFSVINSKNSNEKNVCTKSQVKIATEKGWTVLDWNGGSEQAYAGSEDEVPAGTFVIALTQKVTDISTYGSAVELAFPYLSTLGLVDQEKRGDLIVFKSKKNGKELMEYNPTAKTVMVCDGVTEEDNITYEISSSTHMLIKMMNKGVDPLEGYDRLLIKFDVNTTGIEILKNRSRNAGVWYTIDGKKLAGEPTQKGVYIIGGKKIVK